MISWTLEQQAQVQILTGVTVLLGHTVNLMVTYFTQAYEIYGTLDTDTKWI